jgi:hypothetical protein
MSLEPASAQATMIVNLQERLVAVWPGLVWKDVADKNTVHPPCWQNRLMPKIMSTSLLADAELNDWRDSLSM